MAEINGITSITYKGLATQDLNCTLFLKGTLAEFDGGVKLIITCRCMVRLNYGITTTIGMNSLDSDTAFTLPADIVST